MNQKLQLKHLMPYLLSGLKVHDTYDGVQRKEKATNTKLLGMVYPTKVLQRIQIRFICTVLDK